MSFYCYDGQVSQGAKARLEERMREVEASRIRQEAHESARRSGRQPRLANRVRRWLKVGRKT